MKETSIKTVDWLETGKLLRFLCGFNNCKAPKLGNLIYRTNQLIYQWFNAQSRPVVDDLVAISGLFNVAIDDLLIYEGEKFDEAEAKRYFTQLGKIVALNERTAA